MSSGLQLTNTISIVTYGCRFVDRDAFARFAGIGIGCQHLQTSRVLNIQAGPDYTADLLGPEYNGGGAFELESNEAGRGAAEDNYGLDSESSE
jgi:hypothetical protein